MNRIFKLSLAAAAISMIYTGPPLLADDDDSPSSSSLPIEAHQNIISYDGPATCISCHESAANEMLNSLHMQWAGPTPDLSNTNGEILGKAVGGINTFCTYAMSSGGACFSCHVRADGNAPHAPDINDVDCLICHNDTYQRKFVADPNTAETVIDYLGNEKTYVFGAQDGDGNYTTVPNFDAMPAGTTMVDLARDVHLPTRTSCLRCHAKAGGGDWTKRGDMGLSTKNPTRDEDIHMSPDGADLSCNACHSSEGGHKVGGRGIDLRQTEAATPTCQNCHTLTPHDDSTLNRHSQGQVSCQVCHIREFGKGGATEMSRDWLSPIGTLPSVMVRGDGLVMRLRRAMSNLSIPGLTAHPMSIILGSKSARTSVVSTQWLKPMGTPLMESPKSCPSNATLPTCLSMKAVRSLLRKS